MEDKKVEEGAQEKKKASFRKTTFRGLELDELVKLKPEKLVKIFKAR